MLNVKHPKLPCDLLAACATLHSHLCSLSSLGMLMVLAVVVVVVEAAVAVCLRVDHP